MRDENKAKADEFDGVTGVMTTQMIAAERDITMLRQEFSQRLAAEEQARVEFDAFKTQFDCGMIKVEQQQQREEESMARVRSLNDTIATMRRGHELEVASLREQLTIAHQLKPEPASLSPSAAVASSSPSSPMVITAASDVIPATKYIVAIRGLAADKRNREREVNLFRTVLWVLFAVFTLFLSTSDTLQSFARYA